MVRYRPTDIKWCEMHTCRITVENGEPVAFTFTAYSGTVWTLSRADLINRCMSVPGNPDYKVGDEVITYWIDEHGVCFHGRIIAMDAA